MDQARFAILREMRTCIQQGPETFDRKHLVSVLRASIARDGAEPGEDVNRTYRAFRLVLVLATRTAGAEALEANVGACKFRHLLGRRKRDDTDEPVLATVPWPQRTLANPEDRARGPSLRRPRDGNCPW